jgi:uncharacterized phage infection (PIP) family protein YhgE
VDPLPGSNRPVDDGLASRVESLVSWIDDLDARLRTAEAATGGEKAAKELRKAVEAAAKHDPKLEERVKNRVDVVADRLETLASTVSTTSASIAAKDGELVSLRRELAAGISRMEALAADVRKTSRDREVELRKAIDKLSSDQAKRKRSERDPEVDRKLAYLGERMDTLSTTVQEASAATARREGELAALRKETGAADARFAESLSEIRRTVDPAPVQELRKRVDALAARDRELATLRAKAQDRDAKVTAAIQELRKALTSVAEHVNAVRRDVEPGALAKLDARLGDLEGPTLSMLGGKLDTLEQSLEETRPRLAELETSTSSMLVEVARGASEVRSGLVDVVDRLDALEESAGGIGPRMTELETSAASTLAEVGRSSAEMRSALAGAVDRLDALERRTAEGPARAELDARFDRVESTLDELASGASVLSAELARVGGSLVTVEQRISDGPSPELVSRVERVESALENAATEVRASLVEIERRLVSVEQQPALSGLRSRVDELEDDTGAVAARLAALESSAPDLLAEVARVGAEARASRDDVARRLDSVEMQAADTSALAEVRAQLDALDAAVVAAAARVGEVEASASKGLEDVLRTAAQAGAELPGLERRLDALEGRVAADAGASGRLEAIETALGSVRRDATARDEELGSLRERMETGMSRVDGLVADLQQALAAIPTSFGAAGSLDPEQLVEAWETEREWVRRQLAALASMHAGGTADPDAGSELRELADRIARLEAAHREAAPAPEDGRLRIELEAVEHRLDDLETTGVARLEHVAAHVEWRLQQLEAAAARAPEDVVGTAQVVPFRSTEA